MDKEKTTIALQMPEFEIVENNEDIIKMREIAEKVMYEYTIHKNIKFYEEWLKHYSDDELRNLYQVLEAIMSERGLI